MLTVLGVELFVNLAAVFTIMLFVVVVPVMVILVF